MSVDRVIDELIGQKEDRLAVSEHLRIARDADGAMVLDLSGGQMYQVNPVASRILELLMDGLAEAAIAEWVAREFEIEHNRAEADVREFLETLEKHRLVTRNASSLA
jgi:hypothetical protein